MSVQVRSYLAFLCAMPMVQGFYIAGNARMRLGARPAARIPRNDGVAIMQLLANKKPANSKTAATAITEDEVFAAQRKWADTIVAIGSAFTDGGNHVKLATAAASDLYAFDYVDTILFKPTRCAEEQFRPKPVDALSYFVGGIHDEDTGFAIQPWSNVRFQNHAVDVHGDTAIAMGNYFFTDASTDAISKVEYTFGYRKYKEGQVRIFLHHSSIPFAAAKPDSPGITVSTDKSGGKTLSINIHL